MPMLCNLVQNECIFCEHKHLFIQFYALLSIICKPRSIKYTGAGLYVVIDKFCKLYLRNKPEFVCVYVRETTESISLTVLSTRQYRLLLNKYGLSMSLLKNWTLGYAHTHTYRVIVYVCLQN